MTRCVCVLFILGGLACGQATSPHSLAGKEVANAALTPTAKSSAASTSDLPALPAGKTTLLGGTISLVDHLRDRMVLQTFGGGRMTVLFDQRTRVFRDGKAAAVDDLKNGDRVHADTVLDGTHIFARNICVASQGSGQTSGQILNFEPASRLLTLRDGISPAALRMRLAPDATILRENRPAQLSELRPGTLVAVAFLPSKDGHPLVRQISILALPGTAFMFVGRLERLDLHRGLLVLMDPRDNKTYEVDFNPAAYKLAPEIHEGADITVSAVFDGRHYTAQSIAANKARE